MKTLPILIFLILFTSMACLAQVECISGINEQPLYGEVEKCPQQLEADSIFLKKVDQTFDNRKDAIQYHLNEGWKYFYQNEYKSAVRRFNQAWLMDSLNAEIYWGFGNLLGMLEKYEESLRFFHISISLDSTNAKVWESASTNYGNLYYQTEEMKYLNKTIEYLKKSVHYEPNNGSAYARLTEAFAYVPQVDSAKKYLRITDSIDPSLITSGLRQYLNQQ